MARCHTLASSGVLKTKDETDWQTDCNIRSSEERLMPIAKITGQGLAAIALSVALLWACFIGERLMVKEATACRAQVMRDLHRLQQQRRGTEPVSAPHHDTRAHIGLPA